MQQKFRFKLNLFDAIVLIAALCVAVFMAYTMLKPAPVEEETGAPAVSTVEYTIRFQKMLEGTGSLVEVGDKLIDNIKNYELGTVVAAEIVPAVYRGLDNESKQLILTEIEGYEDVIVTVRSECTMGDAIMLDGGYALRANNVAYIKGEGYMASGPVESIDMEGLK